jgi:hypothetical protein
MDIAAVAVGIMNEVQTTSVPMRITQTAKNTQTTNLIMTVKLRKTNLRKRKISTQNDLFFF